MDLDVGDRSEQVDYVSRQLFTRASVLTRLLLGRIGGELSRTEACVLHTLNDGPRRITELAELERLAQPTMTQLVQRLEEEGLLTRQRQPDDRRVVLVDLTEAGIAALKEFRAHASTALGGYMAEMPDEEVEALAAATEALERLVAVLQQSPKPPPQHRKEGVAHGAASEPRTPARAAG
jgi:DNA-binding MarR family transcriptional regulator